MKKLTWLIFALLLLVPAICYAVPQSDQEPLPVSSKKTVAVTKPVGIQRALIICGLPGDKEHAELFEQSVQKIRAALTNRYGVAIENIKVQFGRPEEQEPPKEPTHGRATRKEIFAAAEALIDRTGKDDEVWVFVIGHTHFDGKSVCLNVPDTDVKHQELAKCFEGLGGRRTTFFICTPASGYFFKGLSKPGRTIICSSQSGYEINGSIFHTHLANALSEVDGSPKFDLDKNGIVSLVDLYILATRNMVDNYLNNEPPLQPTEHPGFDDNGDGRGSELQINYLTPEQGGRMGSRLRNRKMIDGRVAAEIPLPFVLNGKVLNGKK